MSESSPDYSQINGFYGRGSWATWVILLITSWYPILRNDHTHNLHFMSYALYTNWATIDILRQSFPSNRHQTLQEMDDAQLQCFRASLAVIRVGIAHACFQVAISHWKAIDKNTDTRKDIERRQLCIAIGLLLPVLTNSLIMPYLHNVGPEAGIVPFLYFTLTLVSATSIYQSFGQGIASVNKLNNTVHVGYRLLLPLFLYTVIWAAFKDHGAVLSKCSFVPCAPQGIGELDQSFSLLVALFALVYEYGGRFVSGVRKPVEGAATWLISFLVRETVLPISL